MPDKDFLWIAYVGDSQARELFLGAIQRISGYIPTRKEIYSVPSTIPQLGNHSGEMLNHLVPINFPSSIINTGIRVDSDVAEFYKTFHQSRVLCCSVNKIRSVLPQKNHCVYALELSNKYDPEVVW